MFIVMRCGRTNPYLSAGLPRHTLTDKLTISCTRPVTRAKSAVLLLAIFSGWRYSMVAERGIPDGGKYVGNALLGHHNIRYS